MRKRIGLLACLLVIGVSAASAFALTSCGVGGTTEHTHVYESGVCAVCGEKDPDYITSEEASQGVEYTLSGDGTYYIVSGKGTCTDTDLIIPSIYENLPVQEIGEYAFAEIDLTTSQEKEHVITSVTIGGGVTDIGNHAFWECISLTRVSI